MLNLLAYIPVLNQRHIDWFKKHQWVNLWLISQQMAETLVPRLARNMASIPTDVQLESLRHLRHYLKLGSVNVFDPENYDPNLNSDYWNDWILADEDICHRVDEKYFKPLNIIPVFEIIWARWDMIAVKASQPVLPDCEVSYNEIDIFRIAQSNVFAQKTPDWWRQIGIIAFRGDTVLAHGVNRHFPTEYETGMFGDTRVNFDAGDPDGMDAFLSLHAEEYLIAVCAKEGISLSGASVYINTFPCGRCARALSLTGIKKLFFSEGSMFMLKAFEILSNAHIKIIQVKQNPVT